jgi:hypothetical protein
MPVLPPVKIFTIKSFSLHTHPDLLGFPPPDQSAINSPDILGPESTGQVLVNTSLSAAVLQKGPCGF